jgi:hypothetical protein
MDWTTLAAAFIGGIFGGGLGSLVSFLQLRASGRAGAESQQWRDSELVAEVGGLLADINPARRGMNLNPDLAREGEKSAALAERQRRVVRDLTRLGVGSPAHEVRESARLLSDAVARAATASEWYVRDLQAPSGRDMQQSLAAADEAHAKATELEQQLAVAVRNLGKR